MKKRIFTLLAVLILCFALFSCGKDEATLVVESFAGLRNHYEDTALAKIFDTDTTALRVGVSVDSLKGLEEYASLVGDVELPEIEKANADFYVDLKDVKLAQVLSAKVGGKKVEITAVEDLENATVKSNLVDGAYGVETEDLLEDWLDMDILDEIEDIAPVLVSAIAKSEKMQARYDAALAKILRECVDFEKEKDGKYTVISFEIGVKEMDDILEELADVIEDDEDIEDIFDAFGMDIGDYADEMREAFDDEDDDAEIEFELTILAGKSKLIAAEIVEDGSVTKYEGNEKNNDFTMEIKPKDDSNNVIEISFEDGEYKIYSKSVYEYGDGDYYSYETTSSAAFDKGEVAFEYKYLYEGKWGGSVSREEQKASAKFGYKASGDKLTLTLKSVGYGGITVEGIDEKVGITVEIEKNPKLPNGAKKYEELKDADELYEEVFEPIIEELEDELEGFSFAQGAVADVYYEDVAVPIEND